MKLSTKAAVAALALALVAALALRYAGDGDPEPQPRASSPPAAARVEVPRGAARRQSQAAGGIDGTTSIAGAPVPAHVVAGRIGPPRDATTWPRERVRTMATPPKDVADAQADADATGAFALDGLGPGMVRVVATFADGRHAAGLVDLTAEKPRARIGLVAPEGPLSLRGRAVHGDGRPFAGWIRMHQIVGATIETAVWARTDARGAFAFAGLIATRTILLAADETASWSVSAEVQLPFDGEYVFTVDPAAGPLRRGRVVAAADGAPIAGAAVLVLAGRSPRIEVNTTSGDDGTIEAHWSGRATVSASAKGFVRTSVQDDGKSDVVLRLARAAAVVGRVLSRGDGSPVAGAVVRANPAGDKSTSFESSATSADDGAFRVEDVKPGDVDVFVLGGGWVSPDLAAARRGGFDPFVVSVESGATATVELRAERSARAEGHVLDAAGAGVASMGVGGVPSPYFDGVGWRGPFTRTDADGAFALEDLLPGLDHTFTASPAIGLPKSFGPVRTESGKTAIFEIRLDAARRLDLTVLDEGTDAPIAGAVVAVTQDALASSTRECWATDAAGRADVFPVPGGKIGVRAKAAGHVASQTDVVAEEIDATHLRAVVHLAPAKALAGRVVTPDGVSAGGVIVAVRVDPDRRAAGTPQVNESATTAADGSFRFDTLPDGAYVLDAWTSGGGPQYRGAAKARPGDADVVLTLATPEAKGGVLRVRVLDADGAPVAEASVVCMRVAEAALMDGTNRTHRQGIALGGAATVRDGTATLPLAAVEPRYERWIEVRRPKWSAGAQPGAAVVRVPDPPPTEIEIRLPAERRISGRVVAPDGAAVAGVRVTAEPASGPFDWYPTSDAEAAHGSWMTNAGGAFAVGRLGDLTYRVSFAVPAGFAPVAPMNVAAGTSGVEVRLVAGVLPTVTVLDPDGRPVAGCDVSASATQPGANVPYRPIHARTSADGTAKFPALDATVGYELIVSPPQSRDDLLHFRTASWAPADVTVRLEHAWVVAGVVRDADGKPLGGAKVSYSTASHRRGDVVAGADGRFRIARLPAADSVRLRALREGEEDADPAGRHGVVQATAGDEGVVIVLDAGSSLRFRVEGLPRGVAATYRLSSTPSSEGRTTTASGATVSVGAGVGRYPPPRVEADGVLRFGGLDPAAKHRLFVGPTDDGLYGLSDELAAGGDEVVLRMTRGEPLAGRVVLPADVVARDVSVSVIGDSWWTSTTVDADGRFRFPGLPPRAFRVDARAFAKGKLVYEAASPVTPGADIVLELRTPDGR